MADYEPVELEASASGESVTVDMETVPDNEWQATRDRLLRLFRPEVLRVKNAQGDLVPYGVEVMQCRICGAILQRVAGPLLAHAGYHSRERRALAPRRRRRA